MTGGVVGIIEALADDFVVGDRLAATTDDVVVPGKADLASEIELKGQGETAERAGARIEGTGLHFRQAAVAIVVFPNFDIAGIVL